MNDQQIWSRVLNFSFGISLNKDNSLQTATIQKTDKKKS